MKGSRGWIIGILVVLLLMTGCGKGSQPENPNQKEQVIDTKPEEDDTVAVKEQAQDQEEVTAGKEDQEKEGNLKEEQIPVRVMTRYEWLDADAEEFSDCDLSLPDDFYSSLLAYKCDGVYVMEEGYEKLNESLAKNNSLYWKQMYDSRFNIVKEVESFLEANWESAESYFPWEDNSTIQVTRADSRVFSFVRDAYCYLGGAHPAVGQIGFSYEAVSGKELIITDVVTDYEKFCDSVNDKLEENEDLVYGGYENWKELEREIFDNPEEINFYFTDAGIHVVFSAYTLGPFALGHVIAELTYEELSDILKEAYLPPDRQTCMRLEPYETVSVDLDGDGEEEKVQVFYENEWEPEYNFPIGISTTVSVIKNGEERRATDELGLSYCDSYLMENEEGEFYLYVETLSENDWHNIIVFELGSEEGPVMKGYAQEGAFYDMRPFDAGDFYLEQRLYCMGTWHGFRQCRVGKDGFPEVTQDYYSVWQVTESDLFLDEDADEGAYGKLTLLQELEANCHKSPDDGDLGSRQVIPAGTVLTPYRTDGETWMMFQTEDGIYVDVFYDEMDPDIWEKTINGIEEYDLFDGILYAG